MSTRYKLKESANKINKLYENLSYFDQYGGSVFMFFVLSILLFLIWAYTRIIVNIEPIKNDWANQRCNPAVIPFVSFINPPEGANSNEFTQQNFTYCTQNVIQHLGGIIAAPLTYIISTLTVIFEDLVIAFQYIRSLIDKIRGMFASISEEVMGRISNVSFTFFPMIIKLKDLFEKSRAALISGMYTALGSYYTLWSLMGAIVQIVVIILIALAIMIVICWLTLQFWIAIPGTIFFGIISAFLIVILVFCVDVLKIPVPGMPGPPKKPSCFDDNTILKMKDGSLKKIYEIEVGDILFEDGEVTAKMKLDSTDVHMYELFGIIVSGTHRVKQNNKWIFVKDHADAIKIFKYNKPIIYCLNTKSKEIKINSPDNNTNVVFCDWDELFDEEIKTLSKNLYKNLENKENKENKEILRKNIHSEFDIGLSGNTNITIIDNEIKLKDIKPGMKLSNGDNIYGIVEINGKDLKQEIFNLGCINILGSVNLPKLSNNNLPKSANEDFIQEDKLYNLLTDNGHFYINNTMFNDYNSAVELFLDIV
jgi:hypothetical protein